MPARLRAAIDQGVTEAAAYVQGALYRNLSGIEGGGPIRRVVAKQRHSYMTVEFGDGGTRRVRTGTTDVRARRLTVELGDGTRRRVTTQPSRGRVYYVGPGAPPGRFPFLRSGRLRQSAAYEPRYAVNGRIRVGVNTAYARALEFGTSRMAARPFLRRTFQQETQRVQQIIRNRVLVNMQFGGGERA